MRCNFTIDQSVGLQGEFGYLDVHNCYDLVGIATAFENRQVRLNFVANQHNPFDRPPAFAVELDEVSEFEGRFDGQGADALDIDEISFRAPDDRDIDLSGPLGGTPNEGDHLVIRFFDGHLRIGAATANVMLA